jgi:transcriptional regulator with XRE-family HTH domain
MTYINRNHAYKIRRLREARDKTQQQIAKLSGVPRPTWASLETGTANPTLGVLSKAASALNVSIEELVGPPRSEFEFIPAQKIRERKRQDAKIRPLVPYRGYAISALFPKLWRVTLSAFWPSG